MITIAILNVGWIIIVILNWFEMSKARRARKNLEDTTKNLEDTTEKLKESADMRISVMVGIAEKAVARKINEHEQHKHPGSWGGRI